MDTKRGMQKKNKGGLLDGPRHSAGGIDGIIKGTDKKISVEGGEIIVNRESSKEFCQELSDINVAGGGVAIPCDKYDEVDKRVNSYEHGGVVVPPDEVKEEIGYHEDTFNKVKNGDIETLEQFAESLVKDHHKNDKEGQNQEVRSEENAQDEKREQTTEAENSDIIEDLWSTEEEKEVGKFKQGGLVNPNRSLFSGESNNTSSPSYKLEMAKILKVQHISDSYIKKNTGWQLNDIDDKWRYEVSTKGFDFSDIGRVLLSEMIFDSFNSMALSYTYRIHELFNIPEDMKLIDGIADIEITAIYSNNGSRASYNKGTKEIYINSNYYGRENEVATRSGRYNEEDIRRSVVHELQHWLQGETGIATMGAGTYQEAKEGFRKKYGVEPTDEEAHDYYNSLLDEFEAEYGADARLDLSQQQISESLAIYPEDLITEFKNGGIINKKWSTGIARNSVENESFEQGGIVKANRSLFIGESSGINPSELVKAKAMLSDKKSDKEIKSATGWQFVALDGKWRYEITTENLTFKEGSVNKISEMIEDSYNKKNISDDHYFIYEIFNIPPELYMLYGNVIISSYYFEYDNNMPASYDKINNVVFFNSKYYGKDNPRTKSFDVEVDFRRSILHEIQHGIQGAYGTTTGSEITRKEEISKSYFDAHGKHPSEDELYLYYYSHLGEFEARLAEDRADLSQEEIKNSPIIYPDNLIKEFKQGGQVSDFDSKRQSLDEFFTPDWIAKIMVDLAYANGYDGKGPVLEPSFGQGVFFDELSKRDVNQANFWGFEIFEPNYKHVAIKYPSAKLYNTYFEYNFLKDKDFKSIQKFGAVTRPLIKDKFKLIIGNPPYGTHASPHAYYFDKNMQIRAEGFFLWLCGQVLADDGVLVMILPSLWMHNDNKYNYQKEQISDYLELVDAYRMPSSIFEKTKITTDILVFKKSTKIMTPKGKDPELWEQCSIFLDKHLKEPYCTSELIYKCKGEAEKRFCVDYLYNHKKQFNMEPSSSVVHLESFLNEI